MNKDLMILPNGEAVESLEELDLKALAKQDPEKAIIWAEQAMAFQVARGRQAFVQQCHLIFFIHNFELWRFHPGGFNSLSEWAMQPEIDIAPSVLSDMIAIVSCQQTFLDAGSTMNLFDLIEDVGSAKVRKLVPMMREAQREGTLVDQMTPILDQIGSTTLSGMMELVNPSGTRMEFDPIAIYEELPDGTFTLTLRNLDFDALELTARKLNLKRWTSPDGRAIESPIPALH